MKENIYITYAIHQQCSRVRECLVDLVPELGNKKQILSVAGELENTKNLINIADKNVQSLIHEYHELSYCLTVRVVGVDAINSSNYAEMIALLDKIASKIMEIADRHSIRPVDTSDEYMVFTSTVRESMMMVMTRRTREIYYHWLCQSLK